MVVKRKGKKRKTASRKASSRKRSTSRATSKKSRNNSVKSKRKTTRKVTRKTTRATKKKISAKKSNRYRRSVKKKISQSKPKKKHSRSFAKKSANVTKILSEVAKKWRPSETHSGTERLLKELQKKIPQAVVCAGGSFAKGTQLRGSHDIDLFVRFPAGTNNAMMNEQMRNALPKAKVLHGSRDYYQLTRKKIVYEIVPVLFVENANEIENVTDMSPLHVQYVRDNLTDAQKDDTRLAKLFCRSAGVYGAESHIRGFSGYVLELLIAHYKSFEKLLRASTKWPANKTLVIDSASHFSTSFIAKNNLNPSKTEGPLIIVDPLDKNRNAAAAVSKESFLRFRQTAVKFLANPSVKYFEEKINRVQIAKEWKPYKTIWVVAKTPKGRHDIVGSRLRSAHDRASYVLQENGFGIIHSEWRYSSKESTFWYVLSKTKLDPLVQRAGPPSSIQHAVESFRRVHRHAYERNGRWYVAEKRKFNDAKKAIKDSWKNFKIRII